MGRLGIHAQLLPGCSHRYEIPSGVKGFLALLCTFSHPAQAGVAYARNHGDKKSWGVSYSEDIVVLRLQRTMCNTSMSLLCF